MFDNRVLELILYSAVSKGIRIFGSHFVNRVKNTRTNEAYNKLQLIIQVYKNLEKVFILTQSSTIQ